ncbi:MAG: ABC transporter ATP-binding protein [Candidatus Omnitrophota bacterium]|nr:ABC transporter ATP-binding protein [Candidatus Omnitrophota bacterium]
MLRFSDVRTGYSNIEILKGVSFDIEKGSFAGIIGPNGSGKTTLLRSATKTIPLFKGGIFLEGKNLADIPLREFAAVAAVVPQDTAFMFPFRVMDVVLMGRIPYISRFGFESRADINIALEALELADAVHLKDRFIDELSGGERQRVIIAKALAQKPRILFLDEPTTHLDISHQVQIFELLRKMNKDSGLTIVAILHDLNLASDYCDKLILMDKGAIKRKGSPAEVIDYKTIEEVYGAVVIVKDNPLTSRPHVFLVKKD